MLKISRTSLHFSILLAENLGKSVLLTSATQQTSILKIILTVGEKGRISVVTEGKAIKCSMAP